MGYAAWILNRVPGSSLEKHRITSFTGSGWWIFFFFFKTNSCWQHHRWPRMQQVEQNSLYINCHYICATKRAICLTLADGRENIQENMRNNGKYDLLAMTCVLFTCVSAKQKCSRWVCCEGPQGFFDLSVWNRLSCDRSKRLLLLLLQRPQRMSDAAAEMEATGSFRCLGDRACVFQRAGTSIILLRPSIFLKDPKPSLQHYSQISLDVHKTRRTRTSWYTDQPFRTRW